MDDLLKNLAMKKVFQAASSTEFAPGIPDRSFVAALPTYAEPMQWELSLQEHLADRAGCLPGTAKIYTKNGYMPIGKIVKEKLSVEVLSYDFKSSLLEWKPVTNWFINGSTDTWLQLKFKGDKGFTCTPNHNIYVMRASEILKLQAKDIMLSDFLLMPDKNLSEDSKQFMYGAFLGDGSIVKRNCYKPTFNWGHCEKQKEYAFFGANLLKENIEIRNKVGNKTNFYSFRKSHLFNKLLAEYYSPKKTITKEFLNLLDERALAIWYMDDGQWSPNKSYFKELKRNTKRRSDAVVDMLAGQVYLYTNGFTKEENELLIEWLNSKYDLNFKLRNRGKYFYLCQSGIEYNKRWFDLIKKYMHTSMQYKSPIEVGGYIWTSSEGNSLYSVKITNILTKTYKQGENKNQKCSYKKYDIEVKDNHNYFSSDILISNSHYDLRLGDPSTSYAHSWVIKSWPSPGEKVLAIRQPTHTVRYMDFSGTIASGYGKGTVSVADRDKIEVIHSDSGKITFNRYVGPSVEKYSLIRMDDTNWLFLNHTNTNIKRSLLETAPKFKMQDWSNKYVPKEGDVKLPKIDGAYAATLLQPGKKPIVLSPRLSKRTGGPIEYTPKIFNMQTSIVPKELGTTILRTEVYALTPQGKEVPNRVLTSLINSNVWRSRELQTQMGTPLQLVATDVLKYKGRDVSKLPISEKLNIIREIEQAYPHIKSLDTVGKKTIFKEGNVVWRNDKPYKVKLKENKDVFVKDIFDSKAPDRAGGFKYSLTPNGNIVGNVGTGFSHEELALMKQNPYNYIGRVAKIETQEQFPSGAYRAPAFKQWHLDKGEI